MKNFITAVLFAILLSAAVFAQQTFRVGDMLGFEGVDSRRLDGIGSVERFAGNTIIGQSLQGTRFAANENIFTRTDIANSFLLNVLGASSTWDGGGADNNWTTAANWVGDTAPTLNSTLVFPLGAERLTNNNNFAAGTTFEQYKSKQTSLPSECIR